MWKAKDNRRKVLIYACIILVQTMILLYWANVKTNFYIDDLYSFGYASSFTGEGDDSQYITRSPEFGFNEWISNAEFKKYLILDESEKLSNTSFMNAASRMLTGRIYFGLLNIAESIAGYSCVTARPAVVLNIILFVLAEIMLVLLLKKMHMDSKMCYLALIMFGCSTYVISAVEYIRFYMLVILFLILMLMCLHDFWRTDRWNIAVLTALGMGLLAYFSYKNSELTIPFFGGLVLSLIIISAVAKKMKQLLVSIGMVIAGIFYVAFSTNYINVLLYPENFDIQTAGVASNASKNIVNATVDTVRNFLIWVIELFETHYFGSYRFIFMFLGIVTICLVFMADKRNNNWFHIEWKKISFNNVRPIVFYSLISWLVIFEVAKYLGHSIYICKLILFLIVIIGGMDLIGIVPEHKKYLSMIKLVKNPLGGNAGYILVILGAVAIYTVFSAAAGYIGVWRYYVFGFISITIIFWYITDRIMKTAVLKKHNKVIYRILTVFVIISALMPFKERKVEFMYEDEKNFLNAVEDNSSLDVVLFLELDQYGDPSRHETYDCINLMSEDSHIYIVDLAEYKYSKVDYPDEFVLWCHATRDINEEIEELAAHGYVIEELGTDHCSRACVCRKTN